MEIVSTGLRRIAGAAVVLAAFALAGCGSTVSRMPLIGLPDGLPAAPETAPETPSVAGRTGEEGRAPPRRMTPEERQRLEADLRRAGTQGPDERRRRIHRPD